MNQLRLTNVRIQGAYRFKVKSGEVVLQNGLYYVLGANGSGKTTFLKGLAGLYPSGGDNIRLLRGDQTLPVSAYKRYMGYAPQEIALHPHMTVMQFMMHIARLRLIPEELVQSRVLELLAQFGLTSMKEEPTGLLSVGQQKRLMFVQALLADPDLLLLDEPFASVDQVSKQQIRYWIAEEKHRRIIIAAYQPEQEPIDQAAQLLILQDGLLRGPYDLQKLSDTGENANMTMEYLYLSHLQQG